MMTKMSKVAVCGLVLACAQLASGQVTYEKTDCAVTWNQEWSPCSAEGKQSRGYTINTYMANGGSPCPAREVRDCTYAGPTTHTIEWSTRSCPAYTRGSDFKEADYETCQFPEIQATVGDKLVFKYSGDSDVYSMHNLWQYALCDFEDAEKHGGMRIGNIGAGAGNGFEYTIPSSAKDKRLYLASSAAGQCAAGQRVHVNVDAFEHSTLESVTAQLNNKEYETEEGAMGMIERLWCYMPHCPTSALSFYWGDLDRATERCRADAFSLLGFVYRKKPQADVTRAEEYYKSALELHPEHCEATSYMGELYLQTSDIERAAEVFSSLQSKASTGDKICVDSMTSLESEWANKGWCPPPNTSKQPCDASSGMNLSAAWSLTIAVLAAALLRA